MTGLCDKGCHLVWKWDYCDKRNSHIMRPSTVYINLSFWTAGLKICIQKYFSIKLVKNLTYGLDCQEICGNCLNLKQCNHINGSCMEGCDPGFQGEKCVRGTFTNVVFLHMHYERTMFFSSAWVRRVLVNASILFIS